MDIIIATGAIATGLVIILMDRLFAGKKDTMSNSGATFYAYTAGPFLIFVGAFLVVSGL
jgi:hypothetical protein